MRQMINSFLWISLFTFLILFSYGKVEHKMQEESGVVWQLLQESVDAFPGKVLKK